MPSLTNFIESSIEDSKEVNETSQLSSIASGGEEGSQEDSSSGKLSIRLKFPFLPQILIYLQERDQEATR